MKCVICKEQTRLLSMRGTTGPGITVAIKEYECENGHRFKVKTEKNSFLRIPKRKKSQTNITQNK